MKPKKQAGAKLEVSTSNTPQPCGFLVQIRRGKPVWPKKRQPPSDERVRRMEAEELISALADAAHTIGARGTVDNYSKYDFHLYPRHIASLFPEYHPKHSLYAAMDKKSTCRAIVPWPQRDGLEPKTTNELREKPLEIIGLLMRKVLDADSAFFEVLAETVRAAKIEAKQATQTKASPSHRKEKTHAGKVVASMPSYGMDGDRDWFTQIQKPLRRGKAPYAIWIFCKTHYDKRHPPPTRREISGHLAAEKIVCRNLRAQLARMNLDWLPEGGRICKT